MWFQDLKGILNSSGYDFTILDDSFTEWFNQAYTCEYASIHEPCVYSVFLKQSSISPDRWYQPVTLTTLLKTVSRQVGRYGYARLFVKPRGLSHSLIEVFHVPS